MLANSLPSVVGEAVCPWVRASMGRAAYCVRDGIHRSGQRIQRRQQDVCRAPATAGAHS